MSFLDLPCEIRRRIYEFTLETLPPRLYYCWQQQNSIYLLNLLLLNHQIHSEVLTMYEDRVRPIIKVPEHYSKTFHSIKGLSQRFRFRTLTIEHQQLKHIAPDSIKVQMDQILQKLVENGCVWTAKMMRRECDPQRPLKWWFLSANIVIDAIKSFAKSSSNSLVLINDWNSLAGSECWSRYEWEFSSIDTIEWSGQW